MNIANRITLWVLLASALVLIPMSCASYRATWRALKHQMVVVQPLFLQNIENVISRHNATVETLVQLAAYEIMIDHVRTRSEIIDLFRLCLDSNDSIFGLGVVFLPSSSSDWEEGAWYLFRSMDHMDYSDRESQWVDLLDNDRPPPPWERYEIYDEYPHSLGMDRVQTLRESVEAIFHEDETLALEWDWYSIPAETHMPFWAKPYKGRMTGTPLVSYSVPLLDDEGNLFGVLICDMTLDWLNHAVTNFKLPRTEIGQIFLLAADGTVMVDKYWGVLHRNIFDVARYRKDKDIGRIARDMLSRKHGEADYRSPDGKAVGRIVYMPIKGIDRGGAADWSLGVFVPLRTMRDYAFQVGRTQVLIGLVGMALLLLVFRAVARGISRPILSLRNAALAVASGNLDAKLPKMEYQDELAELSESFGKMQDDLKRHMESLAEATRLRERMMGELRTARNIQMSLVPTEWPATECPEQFDLAALMEPARHVGGDFYDFFALDGTTLCLVIADVSGKGIPASLQMARTTALFRASLRRWDKLDEAVAQVNREICRGNKACMFVTLFALCVNLEDGRCFYINAGHNPPFRVPAGGKPEMLPLATNLPIGIDEEIVYEAQTLQLEKGDLLYLYTDGVTEAIDAKSSLFGETRTRDTLAANASRPCAELVDGIRDALYDFVQETPQSDDITMLAFRWDTAGA